MLPGLVVIHALLAIPFRSYLQPLVVMAAIPFGIVGVRDPLRNLYHAPACAVSLPHCAGRGECGETPGVDYHRFLNPARLPLASRFTES